MVWQMVFTPLSLTFPVVLSLSLSPCHNLYPSLFVSFLYIFLSFILSFFIFSLSVFSSSFPLSLYPLFFLIPYPLPLFSPLPSFLLSLLNDKIRRVSLPWNEFADKNMNMAQRKRATKLIYIDFTSENELQSLEAAALFKGALQHV